MVSIPCLSHWKDEMWRLRTPHGDQVLQSPAIQEQLPAYLRGYATLG
jgi:hypothetical protein